MIKVINPGIITTVQDLGRYGYQSMGVSVSGAMDRFALMIGNILNGNPVNTPGLEITYSGFKCMFLRDTTIAITGGNMTYTLNGKITNMNCTLFINSGDILEVIGNSERNNIRGYLTICGGVNADFILGSYSTNIRGLKTSDKVYKDQLINILRVTSPLKKMRVVPKEILNALYEKPREVRVVIGPEEDYFSSKGIDTFFSSEYTVLPESDRMGCRLKGDKIEHSKSPDIISSAVSYGTIQVPSSGMPTILMAECQSTGGYPRIGNVATSDFSKLSQLNINEAIMFKMCSVEEAQKSLKKVFYRIEEWKSTLNEDVRELNNFKRYIVSVNNNNFNMKVEVDNSNV